MFIKYIEIILVISILLVFVGCTNPTEPNAKAQIIKFDPDTVKIPEVTGETDSANEVDITIRKFDEIPLNITGYRVDYIGQDGEVIREPELSHSAGYTKYLSSTEGSSAGENGENVYDYTIKLPVYTSKLYKYVTENRESGIEILPVTAKYILYATDSNMHEHTYSCYIPINLPY